MSSSSEVEAARAAASRARRGRSRPRRPVALQLQAAREQQPVDLVVVGDQQARRRRVQFTHGAAPSVPRRRARIRRRARRAARAVGLDDAATPPSSRSRASAPKRERAERVAVGLERMRGAPEALRVALARSARRSSSSMRGASARNVSTSSRDELGARGVLAAASKVARSIVGSFMSSLLARRRRWLSASTSRSTRIGLVR